MDLAAKYLAKQILAGNLSYDLVMRKFPQFKEEIDDYLRKHGYFDGED